MDELQSILQRRSTVQPKRFGSSSALRLHQLVAHGFSTIERGDVQVSYIIGTASTLDRLRRDFSQNVVPCEDQIWGARLVATTELPHDLVLLSTEPLQLETVNSQVEIEFPPPAKLPN